MSALLKHFEKSNGYGTASVDVTFDEGTGELVYSVKEVRASNGRVYPCSIRIHDSTDGVAVDDAISAVIPEVISGIGFRLEIGKRSTPDGWNEIWTHVCHHRDDTWIEVSWHKLLPRHDEGHRIIELEDARPEALKKALEVVRNCAGGEDRDRAIQNLETTMSKRGMEIP